MAWDSFMIYYPEAGWGGGIVCDCFINSSLRGVCVRGLSISGLGLLYNYHHEFRDLLRHDLSSWGGVEGGILACYCMVVSRGTYLAWSPSWFINGENAKKAEKRPHVTDFNGPKGPLFDGHLISGLEVSIFVGSTDWYYLRLNSTTWLHTIIMSPQIFYWRRAKRDDLSSVPKTNFTSKTMYRFHCIQSSFLHRTWNFCLTFLVK